MDMKLRAGLHNFFDVEVRNATTDELEQTAHAENIILNQYFEQLSNPYGGSMNCLHTIKWGQGNGVPARTQTELFGFAGVKGITPVATGFDDNGTYYVTREIVLGVDEAIGQIITNVGFAGMYYNSIGGSYSPTMTKAMLQDSEGNQISIVKTDTNIVIIRGTFYVTMLEGTGTGVNGATGASLISPFYTALTGSTAQWRYTQFARWPVANTFEVAYDTALLTPALFMSDRNKYARAQNCSSAQVAVATSWNAVTRTITGAVTRYIDTFMPDRIFRSIGSRAGMVNLPNHAIFPPYAIVGDNIGTGNGVDTSYNIGCPVIMTDTETIYIDNVPQVRGVDYHIEYENNCTNRAENFFSAEFAVYQDNIEFGDTKTKGPAHTGTYYADPMLSCAYPIRTSAGTEMPKNCLVNSDTPIWLDFLESKRCNTLKIDYAVLIAAQLDNLVIQYSNNNVVWQDVTNKVRTAVSWKWDTVGARYWRVYVPGYEWTYAFSTTVCTFHLGITCPGLEFTVPPPDLSLITVDYSIDVIYKTAANILQFGWSILFDVGVDS